MLTLVLSCDEPGCDARLEIATRPVNTVTGGLALSAQGLAAGTGWMGTGIDVFARELRCPEHAGAAMTDA